jgi:hypothetical protein
MGDRFGAAGVSAMLVFWAWAQAQSGGGVSRGDRALIKNSYRRLEREAYLEEGTAREIVAYAAQIGALLDFEEHENGRRFTAEVAEFATDQQRAQETFKKRAQRSGPQQTQGIDDACPAGKGHVPGTGTDSGHVPGSSVADGHVPSAGDMSPLPDQIREENNNSSLVRAAPGEVGEASVPPRLQAPKIEPGPDARRLSKLLADLITQRDPRADVSPDGKTWLDQMRLLLKDRDGNVDQVEQVLRWSQTDAFWQANILSPSKLREQFSQLLLKSQRPNARAASPGQQHIQRPTALACPGIAEDAQQVWKAATEKLANALGEEKYDMWLSELHAHHADDQVLVLGGDADTIGWVTDRYGQAIADALGRRIKLEACTGGTPTLAAAA